MNSINLEIPKGYEVDLEKSNLVEGNIMFKEIRNRPTTDAGCVPFLPETCYVMDTSGMLLQVPETRRKSGRTVLTSISYADAFIALMQLIKFRDIWNDGWVADWTKAGFKYSIIFNNGLDVHDRFVRTSHLLSFKKEETRDAFAKEFRALIKRAKPLL